MSFCPTPWLTAATLFYTLLLPSGPALADVPPRMAASQLPDAKLHHAMWNVLDFGAQPGGTRDQTAPFQAALDAAARSGGGTVLAPRGNYHFWGSLKVPAAVTLRGIWESVPSHNGLRNPELPKPTEDGTTFLVHGGAGSEAGEAFITLNTNSTLRGVVVYYPDQKRDTVPQPYPYTVALRGKNPALLDVELLNPYNAIDCTLNERHLVRNVNGQPLRRGIFVDEIYDIGRIENVHFNPWWSMEPVLLQWQMAHGEAFVLGRSDWQYVLNTFCFGYRVGYRFVETKAGVCNGNFVGLGADDCVRAVLVEGSAPYGLLITNGEFVSFRGPDPVMVEVTAGNKGSVRFVNSAFWGPCAQVARIAGSGTVGFGDCTFVEWDRDNRGLPAIEVLGGSVLVRGSEFRADKAQLTLHPAVKRAVVSGNLITGAPRITNLSRGSVVVEANASGQ